MAPSAPKPTRRWSHLCASRRRSRSRSMTFSCRFDVRPHVPGRHQPNIMAELLELARPVCADAHASIPIGHGANLAKKGSDCDRRIGLRTTMSLASAPCTWNTFGQIDANRGNLHVGGPLNVIRLRRSPYGTSMPGAGAVHHIMSRHRRLWRDALRSAPTNFSTAFIIVGSVTASQRKPFTFRD
jgi:hypothetical protein